MSVDWTQIYRTVYPDLVRFLYRKVWDPERAAELAQECFVRALQSRPDQPRAWLFTVAANLAPGPRTLPVAGTVLLASDDAVTLTDAGLSLPPDSVAIVTTRPDG